MCGLTVVNVTQPPLTSCYSPWTLSNLRNGGSYVFSLVPTDGVGNVGSLVTYTWKIGKKMHTLQSLYRNLS